MAYVSRLEEQFDVVYLELTFLGGGEILGIRHLGLVFLCLWVWDDDLRVKNGDMGEEDTRLHPLLAASNAVPP